MRESCNKLLFFSFIPTYVFVKGGEKQLHSWSCFENKCLKKKQLLNKYLVKKKQLCTKQYVGLVGWIGTNPSHNPYRSFKTWVSWVRILILSYFSIQNEAFLQAAFFPEYTIPSFHRSPYGPKWKRNPKQEKKIEANDEKRTDQKI